MWWCFPLAGSLLATAHGFAPAPIRWEGLPTRRFVLTSGPLPKSAVVATAATTPLQRLMIRNPPASTSPDEVPTFMAQADKTITLGRSRDVCVEAGGAEHGDMVRIGQCNGAPTQLWEFLPSSHGRTYQIQLKGSDKCLDVSDKATRLNGAFVELGGCKNTETAPWTFEEPSPISMQLPSQGQTFSSSVRYAAISCMSMTAILAVSFGLWLRRLKKVGHFSTIQDGAPSGRDQGGVSLSMSVAMQKSSESLNISLENCTERLVPAVMALSWNSGKDQASKNKESGDRAVSDFSDFKIPTPIEFFERFNSEEGRELQRELVDILVKQDPRVVLRRSLDLAEALQTIGTEVVTDLSSSKEVSTPRVLRRLCETLGATYVKLGQFIASSPTLFPPEYVQEFQKCLDSTPPMPWTVVRELVESELGRPLGDVYESVDETPLAAASIAQVHAAKLKTGEDVVIKVQRKGVQGSLRADLDLLYATARVSQLVGVVTAELSEVVGTLREAILEEIDFKLEADRTEQFAEFLTRSPELEGLVTVPKVYRSASASRILTLERLYGVSFTDLESVKKYSSSPELAMIVALNTWITSVLTNEWFHADVHAGNLLMLTDGRVAFIDFGIVGSISRNTVESMMLFVRAFPQSDMKGIAEALTGMGFTKELDAETSAAFARDLQEVLDSLEAMPPADVSAGRIDETQLNRAVAAVGRVASNYGIRFPREFALLLKQVLYFDRYTSLLAPNLDVLNDERLSMNQGPPSQVYGEEDNVVDVEVL